MKNYWQKKNKYITILVLESLKFEVKNIKYYEMLLYSKTWAQKPMFYCKGAFNI